MLIWASYFFFSFFFFLFKSTQTWLHSVISGLKAEVSMFVVAYSAYSAKLLLTKLPLYVMDPFILLSLPEILAVY